MISIAINDVPLAVVAVGGLANLNLLINDSHMLQDSNGRYVVPHSGMHAVADNGQYKVVPIEEVRKKMQPEDEDRQRKKARIETTAARRRAHAEQPRVEEELPQAKRELPQEPPVEEHKVQEAAETITPAKAARPSARPAAANHATPAARAERTTERQHNAADEETEEQDDADHGGKTPRKVTAYGVFATEARVANPKLTTAEVREAWKNLGKEGGAKEYIAQARRHNAAAKASSSKLARASVTADAAPPAPAPHASPPAPPQAQPAKSKLGSATKRQAVPSDSESDTSS